MTGYALALSDAEVARYRFMAQRAAQQEAEQWAAAGVVTGAVVADVGCGPGAVSAVLAERVGPNGRVYAVDRDPSALSLASQAAEAAGLSNVLFSQGSADATGLEAGSIDVVMLRHVLAHNGGREQAIVDHLASLVRPGGAVYLVDIEATGLRWHPADQAGSLAELDGAYQRFHAGLGNDLSVGLRLGELLERAGLERVDHRGQYSVIRPMPGLRPPSWAAREQMVAASIIDAGDIARWQIEFEQLDRGEKALTLFVPTFSAFARKPS